MRAAVREIADDDQRACQNDRRIGAHKSNLQVAYGAAKPNDRAADGVKDSIYHPEIENLPEPFARTHFNRLNDRRIVELVNVILVFEQARHRAQRLMLEDKPSNADSRKRNQN